jgi:1,2-phenylacetyl-CoA epoxidase catalytic subunit
MQVYQRSGELESSAMLLQSIHTLLMKSLHMCDNPATQWEGVEWFCFLIQRIPIVRALILPSANHRPYA